MNNIATIKTRTSFYVISFFLVTVIGIISLGQLSNVISHIFSGTSNINTYLYLLVDCVNIICLVGIILKKRWAPIILSASLVISIISYFAKINYSLETRILALIIYVIFILLNIVIYRQLSESHVSDNIPVLIKRDYWSICYWNFTVLAVLTGLSALLFVFIGLYEIALLLLIGVVIFVIQARMFKKHSQKVIEASYILLGLGVFLGFAQNILNPVTFSLSNIIGYILDVYLIYCVYRADKQKDGI